MRLIFEDLHFFSIKYELNIKFLVKRECLKFHILKAYRLNSKCFIELLCL